MALITLSSQDTAILGLKTGHASITLAQLANLVDEFSNNHYQLCRFTLPEAIPSDFSLENQAIQLKPLYTLQHYAYKVEAENPPPTLDSNVSFVEVSNNNQPLYKSIIEQTYAYNPIGYRRLGGLADRITAHQELACLVSYLLEKLKTPNHQALLVYYKGELAGFSTLTVDGNNATAGHSGVLAAFAGKDLFTQINHHYLNYVHQQKIARLQTAIRIGARASQSVIASLGYPTHTSHVYILHC